MQEFETVIAKGKMGKEKMKGKRKKKDSFFINILLKVSDIFKVLNDLNYKYQLW